MRRRAFLSLGAAAIVAPALPSLPAAEPALLTAQTLEAVITGAHRDYMYRVNQEVRTVCFSGFINPASWTEENNNA